jgi:CRISPR-associated protein Csm3
MPTAEWRDRLLGKGLALTESKTEVLIDRIAGKAHDRFGPRQTERVPPGAAFAFEAVCRLYRVGGDEGRDRDCLAWAIQGLDLVEQDALGGSGSRGYGRVAFEGLTLTGPSGKVIRLDGNEFHFRGHAFSPSAPPAALRAAVDEALAA